MERIPTKTISEIIDTASIYCEKLEHNLHCILNAEEQVINHILNIKSSNICI